jgi:single-strand DNA-binding protein
MSSFNKITIVGYLGRDPEIRYTPQGNAVCNFSIATTEKRGGAGGEAQDITTWFRVNLWDKKAELANQYLAKGKRVYIEGRLRLTEYTDREGVKRQSLDVTATDIHFLDSRGDEPTTSVSPQRAPTQANPPEPTDNQQPHDDDIPF